MNEQATMYAPTDYRSEAGTVYDGSHLRVMTTSARIVLAMKTAAMRPSDFEDIFVLMAQIDLTTADEVVAVTTRSSPATRSRRTGPWRCRL